MAIGAIGYIISKHVPITPDSGVNFMCIRTILYNERAQTSTDVVRRNCDIPWILKRKAANDKGGDAQGGINGANRGKHNNGVKIQAIKRKEKPPPCHQ